MREAEEVARIGLYFRQERMRRLTAQHRGALRRIGGVAAHGVDVEVRAAEMTGGAVVSPAKLCIEPVHGVLVESWRLCHQIGAGGECGKSCRSARRAERAEHELGIEAIAAFLEITAVRHLRDDVRGTEELAHAPRESRADADRVGPPLVAGEVQERAAELRERVGVAELAYIAAQERRAARDMRQRVFGAVAVAVIVALAQIPKVVEERGEYAHRVELGAERFVANAVATLVA